MRPALVDGIDVVRGWTYSSCTSSKACSRRSRPIGSLRTVVAGPTITMPAPQRGDLQRLRDGVAGPQQRNAELDQPRADGDVQASGQRDALSLVAHDDLAGDTVAGDDPLVREDQVDLVRAFAEQEGHAHRQK